MKEKDGSFETMDGNCDYTFDIIDEKLRKVKTQRGKVGKRRQRQQQGSAAEVPLMNFTLESGGDAIMGRVAQGRGGPL